MNNLRKDQIIEINLSLRQKLDRFENKIKELEGMLKRQIAFAKEQERKRVELHNRYCRGVEQ